MMCEYRTPPASNAFSELPATESARSFNLIANAVFRESIGSWSLTSHASAPGGAPSP
jgi:hypothetical protein